MATASQLSYRLVRHPVYSEPVGHLRTSFFIIIREVRRIE